MLKLFPGKKKGEILQLNISILLVFFIFWRNFAPKKKHWFTLAQRQRERERERERES